MNENNSLRKFDDSNTNTVNIYSTDKNSPKEDSSQTQQNPNYIHLPTSNESINHEYYHHLQRKRNYNPCQKILFSHLIHIFHPQLN